MITSAKSLCVSFSSFRFRVVLGPTDDGANITMTVMNEDGTPADDIDTYIK